MNENELYQSWLDAKELENKAKEKRLAIEEQIAHIIGVKDDGVTSHTTDLFKVKTTGKLTRTVDSQAVQDVWEVMPIEVQKCFKWEAKLDTKEYRSLCSMRDDLVPHINKYITSKATKPSITIEPKE